MDDEKRHLWPVFICYRQVDGLPAARRLHELLDKRTVEGPGGELIELDVYLDQTMPAVADWRDIHRPYLERSRALIVVCSPGAKINEGEHDWVHREINWWMETRTVAPILIDPLRQGVRYVPTQIKERWPEIQRIALVEAEWARLTDAEREAKADDLRRQIVGAILPSGAEIYQRELEAAHRQARRLRRYLVVAAASFAIATATAFYALERQWAAERSRQEAELNRAVSEASLLDVRAANAFAEARGYEMRWQAVRERRADIERQLRALDVASRSRATEDMSAEQGAGEPAAGARRQNLLFEARQLEAQLNELSETAAMPRRRGQAELERADQAWNALAARGAKDAVAGRSPPRPPFIFSVELLNSGRGESILVHYGTPDDTSLIMINAGPRQAFRSAVEPRLRALKERRFGGKPVPIALFVLGDQDADKSEGLVNLLSDPEIVNIQGIWINVFDGRGLRGKLRELLDPSGIPRNRPFDHHVMRRPQGPTTVRDLPNGLEIVVLGPTEEHLRELHSRAQRDERRLRGGLSEEELRRQPARVVPEFGPESFSNISSETAALPLAVDTDRVGQCRPSDQAASQANVSASDRSIPNLASTVLLFRYRDKTFLHTGDSRSDLIGDALVSAGLMKPDGRAHVDLFHLPHLGSQHNVTGDFLKRVTASDYLFSGDGTYGNPEVATIAALIAARPCAHYTMHFVNRDGRAVRPQARVVADAASSVQKVETHGERLDAFFAAEEQYNPNYRRVFRATENGSVIIDLLDPLTY